MGRIDIFGNNEETFRVPAPEAALVSASLGLAAFGGEAGRRLALVVKDAGFENPSDADFASYGDAWFR
jgi:hypothetical protein